MAEKPGKMRRLGDIVPVDSVVDPIHKPEDNFGVDYILVNFERKEGDKGDYYLMQCVDIETNEPLQFSSGAFKIMAQLEAIDPDETLPCIVRFAISGRTHYIL